MAEANPRVSCGNEPRPIQYNTPSGVAIPNGVPDCTIPARSAGVDRLTPDRILPNAAAGVNAILTNVVHSSRVVDVTNGGVSAEEAPSDFSRLEDVFDTWPTRVAGGRRWLFAAGVVCRRAK